MKSCGRDKSMREGRGKIIFAYSMTLVYITMEIMWNIIMKNMQINCTKIRMDANKSLELNDQKL